MSGVRVIAIDGLRSRLKDLLGNDSLLYQRFDVALGRRDPDLINTAMESLNLYPEMIRSQVQEALLAWLFDNSDASGLAHLSVANQWSN